jgi:hypothetical protein
MDQATQNFIDCKQIAVVGVSRDGKKFGSMAYKELKQRGYQVFAVNPATPQIEGDVCYPNLAALQGKVEGVLLTVPPKQGMQVIQEAADLGIQKVWVQQQADSPELLARGRELGLEMVSGKCILMYAPPVRSFHGWHRAFVKLFGKL